MRFYLIPRFWLNKLQNWCLYLLRHLLAGKWRHGRLTAGVFFCFVYPAASRDVIFVLCQEKAKVANLIFVFFFAVYIDRPTWLDAVVAEMGRFVVFSLGCFFLRFSLLHHLIRHALIRIIWMHQILLELLFEGFEDFKFSQRVTYCESANALDFNRMSSIFIRIDCSLNALSKIFWVRFDKIKRWPAKCSTSSMRR